MTETREMDPADEIGDMFASAPTKKVIHVLVKVPEAAVGAVNETLSTAQMVKEIHEQIVQTKRKRYVHLEMSSNKGLALLQDLNIRVVPARSVPLTSEDQNPEQQRERYREYVEDSIGDVLTIKQLCVLGLEEDKNHLSAAIPGHDVDLVGRTDILSDLAKQFPTHLELLPEVKMLIEVKRKVKGGAVFQALPEMIALDVLVDDPVMALLTDFTGYWQFFWVSERHDNHVIIQTVIIPVSSTAFAVNKTLLAQSPSANAEISLPCFAEPVKRRKLVNVLPSISKGGESGICAAIERYYDIASVLGFDIEMVRALANQVARSIPVFANSTLGYFS
ncbi:CRN-like protein [Plasmopara halstedii]|uniref:CRN-like protein n=1 Tax=Plasmopara halstedii TaxID=4781 RepID=A0A0P1AJZ8_PLAHL|nr:CRN-like protein [Plasmopara halstedii]CEG40909.1 CRN-like protein [Plasmopara halstedii]|eukprot:XP_024577278.1 CRN-like protein [Plasmopara halstedii]